jgi:hypothetical protein
LGFKSVRSAAGSIDSKRMAQGSRRMAASRSFSLAFLKFREEPKSLSMSDKLEPGVDKPRRWQYPIGVIVILIFALLLYWLL